MAKNGYIWSLCGQKRAYYKTKYKRQLKRLRCQNLPIQHNYYDTQWASCKTTAACYYLHSARITSTTTTILYVFSAKSVTAAYLGHLLAAIVKRCNVINSAINVGPKQFIWVAKSLTKKRITTTTSRNTTAVSAVSIKDGLVILPCVVSMCSVQGGVVFRGVKWHDERVLNMCCYCQAWSRGFHAHRERLRTQHDELRGNPLRALIGWNSAKKAKKRVTVALLDENSWDPTSTNHVAC